MKDDIRKYIPDLATVLRESEPAMIKAQKEKTLQAFKEAQAREANEAEPEAPQEAAPKSSPRPVRPAATRKQQGEASPWASSAPAVVAFVPKAVLPSSLAPAAAPARVTAEAPIGAGASKRGKLPRWALPVLAVLAVVVPLVALWLAMRPQVSPQQGVIPVPAGSSLIEESPAPSAVPTVAPSASASSIEERPSASAVPAESATVPLAVTSVPAPPPRPKRPKDAPPSTTSAPSAQPTVAPTVQPAPSGPPPVKAEPVEGAREFGR